MLVSRARSYRVPKKKKRFVARKPKFGQTIYHQRRRVWLWTGTQRAVLGYIWGITLFAKNAPLSFPICTLQTYSGCAPDIKTTKKRSTKEWWIKKKAFYNVRKGAKWNVGLVGFSLLEEIALQLLRKTKLGKRKKEVDRTCACTVHFFSVSSPTPPSAAIVAQFFSVSKEGNTLFICFKHVKSECARDHNGGGASSHPYTRWSKKMCGCTFSEK